MGIFVCLLAGAGLERVRQALALSDRDAGEAPADAGLRETPTARTFVVTNDAAARASNEALRRRVAELERALAARAAEPEAKEPEAPPQENRAREERRPSFTDRMEQFKRDNPEEYAEMQKRREEFRLQMEQRAQDRASFIAAVDPQNMNPEQRENHEKLLATVSRVNEIMAQMATAEGDQAHDLRHEMGDTMRTLGELYGTERRYLFEETARAVGYEGDQVNTFADHMQTIIDNTSMMSGGFGRRGGDRGGGDRGGQPAPAAAAAAPGGR